MDEDVESMLQDCEESVEMQDCPFNDWELDFLENIRERFDEKGDLSDKQKDILEKMWNEIS